MSAPSEIAVKHTPGPWAASPVSPIVGSLITTGAIGGIGEKVAAAIPQRQDAVTEANARLIAAAPDLLHICKTALSALRSYQYGNSATDLAEECADELAREIRIAEGR